MKNIFFLTCLFIAFQAGAQTPSFIGTWKGSEKGKYVYLTFYADSTFEMVDGKDTMSGKTLSGVFEEPVTTSFTVDTSARPMHLDLIIKTVKAGKPVNTMLGIFEYAGSNKIRLRFDTSYGLRPKNFLPKGNEDTMIFVKQ